MHRDLNMHLSPRCGAKTRSDTPCSGPAMPNGRCRMHGGASPGAPRGQANGMYRHGRYTSESLAQRRMLNMWVRTMRKAVQEIG